MKKHLFKRILSMLLAVALVAGYFVPAANAASTNVSWKETDQEVTWDQTDHLAEDHTDESTYKASDVVRVSIILDKPSTVQSGYSTMGIAQNADAMAYNKDLYTIQKELEDTISKKVLNGKKLDVVWNLTLVGNIISANVAYGKIAAIEALDGVEQVLIETQYEPCVVSKEETANPEMYSSSGMTGTATIWSSGYTGAGSRIAVIDTGTDTDHQSLDNGAFLYSLEQNAAAAGMSYEEYVESLDLLDVEEIASVLESLNIYERDNSLTAEDLYLNEKLAYGVNFIDDNARLNIDHDDDAQGEHGSHVAGITTANRYIPSGDGYVDAMDSVYVTGVAPDAQLLTMKVFGKNGGAHDSDYMAAIEDAILLGCDSVNLSLGSANAGSSFSSEYSELLEYMTKTDTIVVASAGNSSTWADYSVMYNFLGAGYLYPKDVNLDTVGAPGSFGSMMTVASVQNDGVVGLSFTANDVTVVYNETTGYGNAEFATLDASEDGSGTDYTYILVDGLGELSDYDGIDLTGKVVFCSRGTIDFASKGNNAASLGAAAVVVYNNTSGQINMNLSGYTYTIPCVSILQSEAAAIKAASAQMTTEDGNTYYTGTLTVTGKLTGVNYGSEYYTMSGFSSWGVPGDLSIKPEITAPGGNIYSIYGSTPYGGGSDQYELMSGTSMAAPQITGMMALLAQYYREQGLEDTGLSLRTLAQSLLMSTAVPMYEEASGGNYYSILTQGAGLARVDLAAAAESYILVDGQEDGKVKAELGDDPERTGVYRFSFSINNMTDEDQDYALSADLFRQDVFSSGYGFNLLDTWTASLAGAAAFAVDGKAIAAGGEADFDLNGDGTADALDADYLLEYLLGNETQLYADGDVNGDSEINTYDAHYLLAMLECSSVVSVPAGGSVTVDVTLTLTESAKALLDALYENGTYVEAYVYAEAVADEEGVVGTTHSIPVLAFYGNWSDPDMFDHGTYVAMLNGTSEGFPYLYAVIGNGNQLTYQDAYGEELLLGGNPMVNDSQYHEERNAVNSEESMLRYLYFSLIRNAGGSKLEIRNADTGEVYAGNDELGAIAAAYFHTNAGSWQNTQQKLRLNWAFTDAEGNALPEGTNLEVSLTAAPEYYRNADGTIRYDELGEGASYTTWFTIDNTAPTVSSIALELLNGSKLTVQAQDENYISAVALFNSTGSSVLAYTGSQQTEAGETITAELDLTDINGSSFLLAVYDYAANATVYEVELGLGETERPYFTAISVNDWEFIGFDEETNETSLGYFSAVGATDYAQAAEYVDGYVFTVTGDGNLWVTNDADMTTRRISSLDPDNEWAITAFCDMAYNYADGKLYVMFYSGLNYEEAPVLATIDMFNGALDVLCVMPEDVNTMAIDDDGNFYSGTYGYYSSLYTYTLDDAMNGELTYVGDMSYFGTEYITSMAWDHNADELYWMHRDTLLRIDTETAEPENLGYTSTVMVGLYIRPDNSSSMFDPTDEATGIELSADSTTVMLGQTAQLEATVWPWNVSDGSVTWTSSDESIATVNSRGVVTGAGVGECTITAASVLDPSLTASCEVTVFELDKSLNALVWDESGNIWWSEFDVTDLPNYTKLSDEPADEYLASTAYLDGTLYAATLNTNTLQSEVYIVNEETFELTEVGASSYAYMDMAPAPYMDGGALMGVYGGNLLLVSPDDGDMYNYWYMWYYNLIGVAYMGSTEYYYPDYGWDTYIEWYFLVDTEGNVYLMGFLEQDGKYYYLEHPATTGGIFTTLDYTSSEPYFSSAYYDGQFLYFSAFDEPEDNVKLFVVDVENGNTYDMGTFPDSVWPVGGLFEMGVTQNNLISFSVDVDTDTMTAPTKLEVNEEMKTLEPAGDKTPKGTLNAVSTPATDGTDAELQSLAGLVEGTSQVSVELTTPAEATNGTMTVTYDPTALTLVSVTGETQAFAYTDDNGTVTIAYAETEALAADAAVATLTFELLANGQQTVTVTHGELNRGTSGKVEELTVSTDVTIYRVYNPNSGEHFFTGSASERDHLVSLGWMYEGDAWTAPAVGEPVYRVYNPNSGDHHYTMSMEEVDMLTGYGWKYEGIAWNSASEDAGVPIYRLRNPNADLGSHHYTTFAEEADMLVSLGWIYEGIGWYASEG